jgi:hypothetical protein
MVVSHEFRRLYYSAGSDAVLPILEDIWPPALQLAPYLALIKGKLLAAADSDQLGTNSKPINYRDPSLSNALFLIQTYWMSTSNESFGSFNFPIFH